MYDPFTTAGETAFPTHGYTHGVTFREWLIGMALAGLPDKYDDFDLMAKSAVGRADAVLRLLDAERPPKEPLPHTQSGD